MLAVWETGPDSVVAKTEVTYTRLDGTTTPPIPNADIIEFANDQVKDWQIYIDLGPLFTV